MRPGGRWRNRLQVPDRAASKANIGIQNWKHGDGRGIPLNNDAILALRAVEGNHDRWCFTYRGKRMDRVGSGFKRALKRVGITDFRFHDLRHTWASWHVTNGTSLQELMELGGWKSYEMVLRYAHLAPDHLSHAAARIERVLEIVEPNSTFFGGDNLRECVSL